MQSLTPYLTSAQVRALAHPLRLRLLELLRRGPATASQLARELGESSGATSYHLRALARAGFVEDDLERGNKRDRWWRRTTTLFLVSSDPAHDADYEAALGELRGVLVERDAQALERYFTTIADRPAEWQEASFLGGWHVQATPEEIQRFSKLILDELDRLRRPVDEQPAGAKPVHITFRALVQPEDEPTRRPRRRKQR